MYNVCRFNAYLPNYLAQWDISIHEKISSLKCNQLNCILYVVDHGLRTPNEGINQRYLKNWAKVADKICFGRT